MIDIRRFRENPDEIKTLLRRKGIAPETMDEFLRLDERWRGLVKKLDDARESLRRLSEERNIAPAKTAKREVQDLEKELGGLEARRSELIEHFPNPPFPDVPVGNSEAENVVIREVGKRPSFTFTPKDYLAIAEELDLIDVVRAGKVAGSRFGYLKREAVLLEFALVKLAFETAMREGFIPVIPPVLVKPDMLRGMGKRKFIEDRDAFRLEEDNLYLAGSAEHTIGPMHADEIFEARDLPRRYVAFSTCFRREAGSYGKDTRGILRVHQFDKIELFSYTTPDRSEEEHKFLLSLQERLMQSLELPYRVVQISTGDMGFDAARQFDIEVWLPSENRYRETHSASNTTDFQARGLHIKFRKSDGGTAFVHTLNATAFSQRPIIAILENFQRSDGSVKIPEALVPYTGISFLQR